MTFSITEKEALRRQKSEETARLQAEMTAKIAAATTNTPAAPPAAIIASPPQPSPKAISLSIEELQVELYKRKEELNKKVAEMKLDANIYRVNIPSIKLLTEDKTPAERLKYIGNIALITGVPIIITACYVGEIYGFSPELDAQIKKLMEFYIIEEVLNVKRSKNEK